MSVSREMPPSIICNARGSSLLSTLSASRSTWKHFLWLFLLRALVPQRRFPRCEFFATREAPEIKEGARGCAYPRGASTDLLVQPRQCLLPRICLSSLRRAQMPRWPLHFKAVLGKSVVGSSASQAPCQTSLTSLASCQTSQVFVKRTVARGGRGELHDRSLPPAPGLHRRGATLLRGP